MFSSVRVTHRWWLVAGLQSKSRHSTIVQRHELSHDPTTRTDDIGKRPGTGTLLLWRGLELQYTAGATCTGLFEA